MVKSKSQEQSEADMAIFIGQDFGQEQRRHPATGRSDEGILAPLRQVDDPAKDERLADLGKKEIQICFHKMDDVLICVPF